MRTTTEATPGDMPVRSVEEVAASLGQALGSLRCAGSQRLVKLGISMTHFHVLTLLRHHDAMPMGRLADILDASMSSTTGIIDRMEERGLVERVRVPDDRRIVLVRLTAAGGGLVDEAEMVKSEAMGRALARMSPAGLARLAAAATDLQAAVNEELASAPERYGGLTRCMFDHGHPSPEGRPATAAPASPLAGHAGA